MGYVLENYHNENILNAQELSGFNRAFAKDEYQTYISQGLYLDDNSSFIKIYKRSFSLPGNNQI